MSFPERIQEVVETVLKDGTSQADMSRALGVTRGTISAWRHGRVKNAIELETALKIENIYDYNHKWLLFGEQPQSIKQARKEIAPNDLYSPIRFVKFKLAAGVTGFGIDYLDEEDNEPLFFKKTWFKEKSYNPDKLFAVEIRGESMWPTLSEGSIVVVNTDDVLIRNHGIYAVNHGGELAVKRIVQDMGKHWLVSDNQDQKSYPRVPCEDQTMVVGRVVYYQCEL